MFTIKTIADTNCRLSRGKEKAKYETLEFIRRIIKQIDKHFMLCYCCCN